MMVMMMIFFPLRYGDHKRLEKQTNSVSYDERFVEIEHELELSAVLTSCQFCTFPLPVMQRHRGDFAASDTELIDLTESLSTMVKN